MTRGRRARTARVASTTSARFPCVPGGRRVARGIVKPATTRLHGSAVQISVAPAAPGCSSSIMIAFHRLDGGGEGGRTAVGVGGQTIGEAQRAVGSHAG